MAARSVIITGAGKGIGEAAARKFAANGDRLTLADADEKAGGALVESLKEQNVEASFVHADVSKRLDIHNILAEALDAYDRIDALIHLDMAHFQAPFLETSEEDFDRIIATNLRGAFLINQAASKQFIKQFEQDQDSGAPGVIVNIGSVQGITTAPDQVAFAASQGGLQQLTKAVALALSPYGVRANVVAVGAVKGELPADIEQDVVDTATPLGRIGDPQEVAEVIFFLASKNASFVTGQTVYVDGGGLARWEPAAQSTEDD